jgi:hypothetical protein
MPRKPKDGEETPSSPGMRSPKLRVSIPLSPEATAEVRSKAAVYRGQLTQEGFISLIGAEVEQRLPVILREIIASLEAERRQRLGLELPPVAVEAVRTEE